MAHDKGDRPSSLKGRRPVITSLEMFLWRNYLIFTSCTAPPSFVTGDSFALDSSVRSQPQLSARDLFHKVSQIMPWSDHLHLTWFVPLMSKIFVMCSRLMWIAPSLCLIQICVFPSPCCATSAGEDLGTNCSLTVPYTNMCVPLSLLCN